MEHNYAIENHTAERYLLQELNEQERDAYEEHFFSCSACAEEVKIAAEFLDSAKRVVQQELKEQLYGHVAHRSLWGSWLNWRSMVHPMPAMACLLLVVSVGFGTYQNRVTIPELKKMASAGPAIQEVTMAQMQKASAFLVEEPRGEGISTVAISRGKMFQLQFDVPPEILGAYQFYQADLMTSAGVKKISCKISKEEVGASVYMPVPPGILESGKYSVVIQGVNSIGPESGVKGKSVSLSFQLNIQD